MFMYIYLPKLIRDEDSGWSKYQENDAQLMEVDAMDDSFFTEIGELL